MQLRAWARFAHVACKWPNFEESQQRKQLSDAVLQRRAGQTPFVIGLERKTRLGGCRLATLVDHQLMSAHRMSHGTAYFDTVSFIEDDPVKLNGVKGTVLFDQYLGIIVLLILASPALLLLPISELESVI